MRKSIPVLALLAAPLLLGQNYNVPFNPPAVAGGDYSDILFWMSTEDDSSCTGGYDMSTNDHSEGDIEGTCNTATINDASPLKGAYDVIGTMGSTTNIVWDVTSNDIFDPVSGRVGCWFKWGSSSGNPIIFDVDDGANDDFRFGLTSGDNDVIAYWNDGTQEQVASSTSPISDATAYFVEVRYDSSIGDGSDEMEIYLSGSSIASLSNLTMSTLSSLGRLRIGEANGSNTGTFAYDVCIISNDPDRDLWALVNPAGNNYDSYNDLP